MDSCLVQFPFKLYHSIYRCHHQGDGLSNWNFKQISRSYCQGGWELPVDISTAGRRLSPSSLFPFLVSPSRSLVSFLILNAAAVLLDDNSFVYKKSLFTPNLNPHHCHHVRSSFCWGFRCRPRCSMFAFSSTICRFPD